MAAVLVLWLCCICMYASVLCDPLLSRAGHVYVHCFDSMSGVIGKTCLPCSEGTCSFSLINYNARKLSCGVCNCVSQLWDSSTGMVLADLKGHKDMVTWCALSCSGKMIVSCSEDLTVKVRAMCKSQTIGSSESPGSPGSPDQQKC